MGRVPSTHVDARAFRRVIAIATVTSWMHWAFAAAIARPTWTTMVCVMTKIHASVRWMNAAYATGRLYSLRLRPGSYR